MCEIKKIEERKFDTDAMPQWCEAQHEEGRFVIEQFYNNLPEQRNVA